MSAKRSTPKKQPASGGKAPKETTTLDGELNGVASHMQTLQALQASEDKFQTLVDSADEAICTVSREGVFLFMNETSAAGLGGKPDELVGRTMHELFPPEVAERQLASVRRVIDSGRSEEVDSETVLRGQRRWYHSNLAPVRERDGRVSAALVIARDVSARRAAEEALRQAHAELERRVAGRTDELTQSNERLRQEIAERKRTEEALQRAHQQLRAGVDSMPVGYILWDMNFRVLEWNPAAERIYGYKREEVLGNAAGELINPSHSSQHIDEVLRILEQGLPASYTARNNNIRKDGTLISCQWHNTPLSDGDGKPFGILSIVEDVTERQRAEEALRQSEERWQFAIEGSGDGVWDWDLHNEPAFCSTRMKQILGYGAEEDVSAPMSVFDGRVHADDRERAREVVDQHLKGKTAAYAVGYRAKCKNGNYKWVLARGRVVARDNDGEPTRIIGTCTDISPRKAAEAELAKHRDYLEQMVKIRTGELTRANEQLRGEANDRRRAEDALKESEEKYRALTEGGGDIVYSMTPAGILTYASPQASHYGFAPESICGRGLLELVAARDRKRVASDLEQAVAGGNELSDEFRIQAGDGSTVWLENRARLLRGADGEALTITGILRDISGRKEAEAKARAYQKEVDSLASKLSLAEEQERQRIATTLHDSVGQLLAVAKIKLGELGIDEGDAERKGALLSIRQFIDQAIDHTRSLTTELSPPALYELGLVAAVEWLADQMREQHGLAVTVTADDAREAIDEEIRNVLFQAVRELLVNVAKHAQATEARVAVNWTKRRVHVHVRDDGVGFHAPEATSKRGADSGFGLFSIRQRLEHLGGSMQIKSEPGGETHVQVSIRSRQR